MNDPVKLFSSIKFPLFHHCGGALRFFQIFSAGGDGDARSKNSKVFHLIILFLILQPLMVKFSFAGTSEVTNEVSPCKVMFRELAYNEDVEGGFSGFKLLEVEREGFRKLGVGSSELLSVVSLPLNDSFNEFSAKITDDGNSGERNAYNLDCFVVDVKKIVRHEPLASLVLYSLLWLWLIDFHWKLGTLIWGCISSRL